MRCSSKPRCGAPCRSPSGSAGSAGRRSAPGWFGPSPRSCRTTDPQASGVGMRRLGVVLMVLATAGCDVMKDAFSARVETVARADGQTLSVDRIAQWAGLSKQVPLTPEALSRLAHVYVDYTLLALQLAQGQTLDDSATTLAAMWPIVAQMKWERFHDRLVAARTQLTLAQVDRS